MPLPWKNNGTDNQYVDSQCPSKSYNNATQLSVKNAIQWKWNYNTIHAIKDNKNEAHYHQEVLTNSIVLKNWGR